MDFLFSAALDKHKLCVHNAISVCPKPPRCLCNSEPGVVDSLALSEGLKSLKLKKFVVCIEPLVAGFQIWKQALLCLGKGRAFSSLKERNGHSGQGSKVDLEVEDKNGHAVGPEVKYSASDSCYSRGSGKSLEKFPGTFPQSPAIWSKVEGDFLHVCQWISLSYGCFLSPHACVQLSQYPVASSLNPCCVITYYFDLIFDQPSATC